MTNDIVLFVGLGYPWTRTCVESLACILEAQGKHEEAA